jgi:hypothetical protein
MLVEPDAGAALGHDRCERGLADLERVSAQIASPQGTRTQQHVALNRPSWRRPEALGGIGVATLAQLILKRASASRPSGEWSEDDYDVLADEAVVGRIMRAAVAPEGTPWLLARRFLRW